MRGEVACQGHTGNDREPEPEPSTFHECNLYYDCGLSEGGGLQAGRSGLHVPSPGAHLKPGRRCLTSLASTVSFQVGWDLLMGGQGSENGEKGAALPLGLFS